MWTFLQDSSMWTFLLKAFITLFVVIDPIGLLPIFITLVNEHSPDQKAHIARRSILVAAAILVAFTLSGSFLLRYLDISIEAFQVAAGLLLLRIAVDMVFVQLERETTEEEKEARLRQDISVFPLAIPLIAGPGTLASLLILADESHEYSWGVVLVLAIAGIVLLIAYGLFYLAESLAQVLGKTGVNVVTRVLGVLLAALAVQYMSDGVIALLKVAFAS